MAMDDADFSSQERARLTAQIQYARMICWCVKQRRILLLTLCPTSWKKTTIPPRSGGWKTSVTRLTIGFAAYPCNILVERLGAHHQFVYAENSL